MKLSVALVAATLFFHHLAFAESYQACEKRLRKTCKHACDGYDPANCTSEKHLKVCAPLRDHCLELKNKVEAKRDKTKKRRNGPARTR